MVTKRSLFSLGVVLCISAANAQTVDQQSWKIEPGEMSAKQAGKIAASYAKKLGLKDLDIKAYRCFARSTTGDYGKNHREWLFYKNNDQNDYQFCIETRTGEFRHYMNWKLAKKRNTDLKIGDIGAFAQTRRSLESHVTSYVKLLGLPEPLAMPLFSLYGHNGRLKNAFSMVGVHYERNGRYYSLLFDPQTGRLSSFSLQNNRDREWSYPVPKADPRQQARAVKIATDFAAKLGLHRGNANDIMVTYSGSNVPKPYFAMGHPLWSITIDAKRMQFRDIHVLNQVEHFEKGDKPCVTTASDAAALVHRYGQLLGLDPKTLKATIKNGMEECIGWVGWITGEYRISGKTIARIKLDLYQGALLQIAYNPAGLPKPVSFHH